MFLLSSKILPIVKIEGAIFFPHSLLDFNEYNNNLLIHFSHLQAWYVFSQGIKKQVQKKR